MWVKGFVGRVYTLFAEILSFIMRVKHTRCYEIYFVENISRVKSSDIK